MNTFDGKWLTSFGPMELAQDGARVNGTYDTRDGPCSLAGQVSGGRLAFTYQEPEERGEGWFELRRRGHAFAGRYQPEGREGWGEWEGERVGFDGLWNSSFGLLRLVEEGGRVVGGYAVGDGGATLVGRRAGDRLVFRYKEPGARGRGRFELTGDGLGFRGEWRAHGRDERRPWDGARVRPQPDLVWLVILEASWQRFLSEREYAFGTMLREFFARLPHVAVRHRFFADETGLRKCLRDLAYLAEPVVLVLATHGEADGLRVDGRTIGVEALAEELRLAGDVRLLHFSACLLMSDPAVMSRLQAFSDETGTAVSGYRTSVPWSASAIVEFTFLELILAQGRPPAGAAEQLHKLLPFVGDKDVPDAAFPPLGFRLLTPRPPARSKRRRTSDGG